MNIEEATYLDEVLEALMPLLTPSEILELLGSDNVHHVSAMCRGMSFLDRYELSFHWAEFEAAVRALLLHPNWGVVITALDTLRAIKAYDSITFKMVCELAKSPIPIVAQNADYWLVEALDDEM